MMPTSADNRAPWLLGLLASALAVAAIAAAVTGMARDIGSLGLIAAAIAAVLAAAVVWLSSANASLVDQLTQAELQNSRLSSTSLADQVTQRITGGSSETSSAAAENVGIPDVAATTDDDTVIRTPAGDLTGLDLGDTSDLADPDTGLLGERYFVVTLEARVAAARRHLRPLALVLLDAVSDASGAASAIDANLAADVVRETLRDADTLCRLQSGRFAILLEDTPENGAIWTVERIRRRLGEQLDDVTVWAGIACYPANGFDGPEVLDRASEALTQAREWRQDRTEVADT